ncbi:MAG: helix-turn-helix domain-containing protein [Halodesulfurarchaeum sp.]
MSHVLERNRGDERICSLNLRIRIEPLPACPLADLDPDVVVHDARSMKLGSECHCEFVFEYRDSNGESADRVTRSEQDNPDCPCCAICEAGCLPNIVEIRPGALILETFVRDRDQAFQIIKRLNETPAKTELLRISEQDDGSNTACTARIDLSELTDTQRETIELAFERGYYDSPKKVILSDLAAEIGVSKQAVAQRLSTAELKIIRQIATK